MEVFHLAAGLGGWLTLFYVLVMAMSGRIDNLTTLALVAVSPVLIISTLYFILQTCSATVYICMYILYAMISKETIIISLLIIGTLLAVFTIIDTYILITPGLAD